MVRRVQGNSGGLLVAVRWANFRCRPGPKPGEPTVADAVFGRKAASDGRLPTGDKLGRFLATRQRSAANHPASLVSLPVPDESQPSGPPQSPRLQHLLELYAQLLQRVTVANGESAPLVHGPAAAARVVDRAVRLRQQLDSHVRTGELDAAQRRRLFALDEKLADHLAGAPTPQPPSLPRRALVPPGRGVPAARPDPARSGGARPLRQDMPLSTRSGGSLPISRPADRAGATPPTRIVRGARWTWPARVALVSVATLLMVAWITLWWPRSLDGVLWGAAAAVVTCVATVLLLRYVRLRGYRNGRPRGF